MAKTLLLIRHAKSDWDIAASDRDRPLAARGRRQAPATGRWIADRDLIPEQALVSPAARARQTWDLVAGAWAESETDVISAEAAYTFDGEELLELVRGTGDSVNRLAITGHNPAISELVEMLTGRYEPMPTSALAVIELSEWATAGDGTASLLYAGRPADDSRPK